jgi:hypothetical protein
LQLILLVFGNDSLKRGAPPRALTKKIKARRSALRNVESSNFIKKGQLTGDFMPRTSSLLIAAVGVLSLSSCAPTTGTGKSENLTPNDQCFQPSKTSNFRGTNKTFYLRSQNRDIFELKTTEQCPETDFNLPVKFNSHAMNSYICTGDTSIIEMSGQGIRSLCRVQVVKKLTEAEIAALPSQDRRGRD